MGKQHDTFPDEKPEMPERKDTPEIGKPEDPKQPETLKEDPQVVPDEYPPDPESPEPNVI